MPWEPPQYLAQLAGQLAPRGCPHDIEPLGQIRRVRRRRLRRHRQLGRGGVHPHEQVPLVRFGVLTAIGSLIWLGAMTGIGYGVGAHWKSIAHGFSDAGYVIAALAVVALAYGVYHRYRSYKAATAQGQPAAD